MVKFVTIVDGTYLNLEWVLCLKIAPLSYYFNFVKHLGHDTLKCNYKQNKANFQLRILQAHEIIKISAAIDGKIKI